jgi:hypothetical protein
LGVTAERRGVRHSTVKPPDRLYASIHRRLPCSAYRTNLNGPFAAIDIFVPSGLMKYGPPLALNFTPRVSTMRSVTLNSAW